MRHTSREQTAAKIYCGYDNHNAEGAALEDAAPSRTWNCKNPIGLIHPIDLLQISLVDVDIGLLPAC